jgi:hypothetical protein
MLWTLTFPFTSSLLQLLDSRFCTAVFAFSGTDLDDGDSFSEIVNHYCFACSFQLTDVVAEFVRHVVVAEFVDSIHILKGCDLVAQNQIALAQNFFVNSARLL